MNAILQRRSIRKYTAEAVSDQDVEDLLRAAMSAPSAGNQQPWEFVVIRDRETMKRITSFHHYAAMLNEAPLTICICGDLGRERHKGYWVQDCSAATENILIQAQANGLGAVWLGVYPREERVEGLKELLGVPEGVVPFALVAVGHPGETKETPDRLDPKRVHSERW